MAGSLLTSTGQDIRFALRQLRRSPGFTTTAVLTPSAEQTGAGADFIAEHARSFVSTGVVTDSSGGVNLWVGEGMSGHAVALGAAAVGMMGTALMASFLPARRASQTEPSVILRAE